MQQEGHVCSESHWSESGVSGSCVELPSGDAQSLWAERDLQSQLRQGARLWNGWTEEVKAALRSQGFYWNHRGEGKLFNMEYRVMCIAVTAPPWRRINLYRLKLQYSVEPAWKKKNQKTKTKRGQDGEKIEWKYGSLVFNQTVRLVEWYYFLTLNCCFLACSFLLPETVLGLI